MDENQDPTLSGRVCLGGNPGTGTRTYCWHPDVPTAGLGLCSHPLAWSQGVPWALLVLPWGTPFPHTPPPPRRGHGDSLLPHPLRTSRGLCCSRVQPCSGLNGFPIKNQGRMLTSFSHYGDRSLPSIFQGLPLVIPPAGISPGTPPSPFFQVQGWELSGLRAPQGSPRIWGRGGAGDGVVT